MYEPRIVGFLCTWCSYTGADTAGIARMKYPANLRAIRVPCSGRVSPELIMRAFDQGADGVIVLGCHLGECHYDTGNHRTAKRIPALKTLMTIAGLEPERLRLDWVSASEGDRFARIVTEFTEAVRELGPIHWRVEKGESIFENSESRFESRRLKMDLDSQFSDLQSRKSNQYTLSIQNKARELLESGQVGCVIGYEVSPRGRTRPVFVYDVADIHRLVWNGECTHNLATYLPAKLSQSAGRISDVPKPVAVVAKPCDSRAINVQLAENQYRRDQVHILGLVCPGITETGPKKNSEGDRRQPFDSTFQGRCQRCTHREPFVYDTMIGEVGGVDEFLGSVKGIDQPENNLLDITEMFQSLSHTERLDFWLSQFDRCLRCYACRQVCPACNCPTCLYERDDSLWVGMGIGVNEKRAFHLGRAFHLAGRCVGCDECERVCPVGIPISLLNQSLAHEILHSFGYSAGTTAAPPPLVTRLSQEEV